MAVPVEEKPSAKLQITPLVSDASKTILAVNGGNSAGSRKIALRDSVSTAQQEFTRSYSSESSRYNYSNRV